MVGGGGGLPEGVEGKKGEKGETRNAELAKQNAQNPGKPPAAAGLEAVAQNPVLAEWMRGKTQQVLKKKAGGTAGKVPSANGLSAEAAKESTPSKPRQGAQATTSLQPMEIE